MFKALWRKLTGKKAQPTQPTPRSDPLRAAIIAATGRTPYGGLLLTQLPTRTARVAPRPVTRIVRPPEPTPPPPADTSSSDLITGFMLGSALNSLSDSSPNYDPPSIPDSTPDTSSFDFGGGGGFDGGGGGSDF